VVADGFHDGVHATVADAEALAGHPANIGFSGSGAIKRHIPDDHILLRGESGALGWIDDDLAARQPFAHVVVAVAFEDKRHAPRDEGAEALAGGTAEVQPDRVLRQTVPTISARHLATDDRTGHAIDVADGQGRRYGRSVFQRRPAQGQQRGLVQGLFQPAVAKPNSSAPSNAPITTSRPVLSWPSTSTAR
jgi:hypothetical protein